MATPAPCCRQALLDATLRWPLRDRANDGILGDAAHQARKSDHNDGNAYDLTNDPAHGVDCNRLSRLVLSDSRVTYVIWNRQIYNRERPQDGWREYKGPNPHNHHMHVSIKATSRHDSSPWPWSPNGTLGKICPIPTMPHDGVPLQVGSRGNRVTVLQAMLWTLGENVTPDGVFGHGTFVAVQRLQRRSLLKADGVVGPKTWAALWQP